MPITLLSKYLEDVSGNKYAPITTPNAVRWSNGDNLDDKLSEIAENTAGTTNNANKKMFLVGAESQAANPQTYSNSDCYIGTDNCLYSGGNKVLTAEQYTGTVTLVKIGTTAYDPLSGIVSLPAYPTTLPASDVSAWAKEDRKPEYFYPEIEYEINTTSSAGGAITLDPTYPIHKITLTGAVSGITFTNGLILKDGHSCHVIFTSSSNLNVVIAHDATMSTVDNVQYKSVCPQAEDVTVSITAGGYVELDLLRIGNNIYVRGV